MPAAETDAVTGVAAVGTLPAGGRSPLAAATGDTRRITRAARLCLSQRQAMTLWQVLS